MTAGALAAVACAVMARTVRDALSGSQQHVDFAPSSRLAPSAGKLGREISLMPQSSTVCLCCPLFPPVPPVPPYSALLCPAHTHRRCVVCIARPQSNGL